MTINWFPGHMAKTRRLISENIRLVDIVIELLDARIPYSSQNPEIRRLCAGKPSIILLNKASLADPAVTKAFSAHYSNDNTVCIETDCISGSGLSRIAPAIRELCGEKLARYEEKGMVGRSLKAMVVGIPNVGKSSLINGTLYPILSQHFYRSTQVPLQYASIEGIENIDKVVRVDQSPLGRSPRSNPATYTGVFADIRKLYVELPEAQIRGYKPGRFSFNVSGGRCETCKGNGYRTIEMNFLPDVLIPCEDCCGKRYNRVCILSKILCIVFPRF